MTTTVICMPEETRMRRVLLIESINLTSIAYLLAAGRRFDAVRYLFSSPRMLAACTMLRGLVPVPEKIEYADFPGSYFDAQEAATQRINDALCEERSGNLYRRMMLRFCKNPLFELAMRNEVNIRYTQYRAKALILLRYLAKEQDEIWFFPRDSITVRTPEGGIGDCARIPAVASIRNAAADRIRALLWFCAAPVILCGVAAVLLGRGLLFGPVSRQHYRVGYDMPDSGVQWHRGYHEFFLYDTADFHPREVLHVFRGALHDERTRQVFDRYGYPRADFRRCKVPLHLYLRRVLSDFLLKGCWSWLTGIVAEKSACTCIPALAVMKMTLEAEIFYASYDIDVFVARDDFNPFHIVRTLVAREHDNRTASFSIGDYSIQNINYILFDTYALWGDFYREFHEKSLRHGGTAVIGAGIYGIDKTHEFLQRGYLPEKYRERAASHRLVLIAGTSYAPDIFVTKETQLAFYRTVLEATDAYPDVIRVIRPKADELQDRDFAALFSEFERVLIETELWIYRVIPVCDLVICLGSTSIGIESLLAGKKVLYYDNTGWRRHIYAPYSEYLVAFTRAELDRNLARVLRDDTYLDDATLQAIRTRHGYRFDGNVAERFRALCRGHFRTGGEGRAGGRERA
ncbi:MAG: hypothetical protein GKC04_00810 [Methanomicrobiales archaeon]|nr:hypothetical protein [Methanomicrobiales archaeon]